MLRFLPAFLSASLFFALFVPTPAALAYTPTANEIPITSVTFNRGATGLDALKNTWSIGNGLSFGGKTYTIGSIYYETATNANGKTTVSYRFVDNSGNHFLSVGDPDTSNPTSILTYNLYSGGKIVGSSAVYEQKKAEADARDESSGRCSYNPFTWFKYCLPEALGVFLLKISGWALSLAGVVLNFVVDELVVGMGDLYKNQGVGDGVEGAWKTLRDIANSLFIFILLYAAFNVVLGSENGLKLVPRIIVVALLMNFSLLFSQTIIDVSNKMAEVSFQQIKQNQGAGSSKPTIAGAFIAKTKLSSIYKPPTDDKGKATPDETYRSGLDGFNFLVFAIFSSAFLIALAIYFLVLSAMLLARFVVLIILMIVSVLAFLAYLLPAMQNHAKTWWSTLLGQSFFAPAVFLMLYATLKVQESVFEKFKGNDAQLSEIVTKEADPKILGIIVTMLVLIGLLLASIVLGKKLSNIGSQGIIGIGKRVSGFASGAALGMAGAGLRGTLGRGASALMDNKKFNRWADNSALARMVSAPIRGIAGKAKEGSFDFRGSRLGKYMNKQGVLDAGKAGGDGGYEAIKEEREELAAKRVAAAAKYDYSEEEKRDQIAKGLRADGKRGDDLRTANRGYRAANRDVTVAKSQLAALEEQKKNNTNPWATAGFDAQIAASKARIKTFETRSTTASADWEKAQNKHLFGHEAIGNYSQAVAHRATAKDWMGHIGGAAAIAGGFALGGVPLGLAAGGAALALGGARGFVTLKRYATNKGGSGYGLGGMSDAVADSNYADAAAKAAGKVRAESDFKKLQKIIQQGQILNDAQQKQFENLRRAGFGSGGGGKKKGGGSGSGGAAGGGGAGGGSTTI